MTRSPSSFLVYPMNFVQFTMTLPFSNFLTTPQRMFSLMLRLSSCARLLKMVIRISPVPSSVLIPSFSNTTATFFSFSFRMVTSESTVFLANLLTDFVRIMSIFPARASCIMALKSALFLVFVPLFPSSA